MTLWAITSYFNPAGYRRRLANYRAFRGALPVPLLTVEWTAPGGVAELGAGDAEALIHVEGGDVMWQKERLLNVALAGLPSECETVAWIDADVVFAQPDWPELAMAALARAPLVHLFAEVRHRPPQGPAGAPILVQPSRVARIERGGDPRRILRGGTDRGPGSNAGGFAWAARRGLLDAHGFYDASIIGGGDTALVCAAYGMPSIAIELHAMNARQRARYLAWAGPFFESVRGSVASIPGAIDHLWHGAMADRRPSERHADLGAFAFDPDADLAVAPGGAWRWNSDKPDLHAYARAYFDGRREDG